MTQTPEYKEKVEHQPQEEIVKEIPETPEIPAEIEQSVQVRPSQITTQVSDDSGKPMMQPSSAKTVTITLPAQKEKLEELSKGPSEDSITWFSKFWLRIIKKAFHYGWSVVKRKEN